MEEIDKHVVIYLDMINNRLRQVSDIYIPYDADPITRAENYVKANDYFNSLNDKELYELVEDLGLLPLVFLLPGVDEIHTRLLNDFDYSGYVRYIDMTIVSISTGETINYVLSDLVPDGKEKNRNNAILYILDYLINNSLFNYPELLNQYYEFAS